MGYSQVLEAPSGGFTQARVVTRGRMRGALALFMATLCMLAALVGTAVAPQEAYAASTLTINISKDTLDAAIADLDGFTPDYYAVYVAGDSTKDTKMTFNLAASNGVGFDKGGYTAAISQASISNGAINTTKENVDGYYVIFILYDSTNNLRAVASWAGDTSSTDGVNYSFSGHQESNYNITSFSGYKLQLLAPTITATAGTGGTASIADSNGSTITSDSQVKYGTSVTLTATANAGYVFKNWTNSSGSSVSTSETYTPTVTTNATYTANFEQAEASLTTSMGTTYGELQDIAMAAGPQYVGVITILKSGLERQNLPSSNVGLPQGMQVKSGVTTDKGVTITINKQGTDIAWDDSDNDGNTLPHGFHFWAESNATDQSVTVSNDGTSSTRTMYAYTEGTNNTMVKVTSTESDFTLNSNASGTAGATVTGITAGKSVSIGKYGGTNTVTVTAASADDTFSFNVNGNVKLISTDSYATVSAGTATSVDIGSGETVAVPSANIGDTVITKQANGGSEVTLAKTGDAVTVNGKTYTAAADDTTIAFDKDGAATLTADAVTIPAGKSVTVNGKTVTAGSSSVTVTMNSDGTATVEIASGDVTTSIGGTTYGNSSRQTDDGDA